MKKLNTTLILSTTKFDNSTMLNVQMAINTYQTIVNHCEQHDIDLSNVTDTELELTAESINKFKNELTGSNTFYIGFKTETETTEAEPKNNPVTRETKKEIFELLEQEKDTFQDAMNNIDNSEAEFTAGNYRFIHNDNIDKIQQDELAGDEYLLGCFNASFLTGVLNIDEDTIKAMQTAEAFEVIGKLIISLNKLEELQEEYSSADGYGHHFNHYDGGELEIGDYHVFQID